MAERRTPDCGTYRGYVAHVRRGEEPDDACRKARNDYQAEYRQRKPRVLTQQVRQAKIRARALSLLAEQHPTEYRMLYEQQAARLAAEEAERADEA